MFDLLTQNTYSLESLSQDEFTSWSPVVDDEYAYISRPNFPEAGGDLLCIGKIDRDEPVLCIDQFEDYSLSSGNQFSWKLDGNNAFILAGNDTGTYYLEIDFKKNQVTPTISIDGYQLSNFWSPDDRWIVFYGLYLM